MSRRLADGEKRIIRASRGFSMFKNHTFVVEAERIDCYTPYVGLTLPNGASVSLTDVATLDLIDRLQRALSVLPSSK